MVGGEGVFDLVENPLHRNVSRTILEPAAHGMGAPQAFQNDLQMPTQKPDLGLKMVSVRHFSTSNRNGEKIARSL